MFVTLVALAFLFSNDSVSIEVEISEFDIIIICLTPIKPIMSYKKVSNEAIYRRNPLEKKIDKFLLSCYFICSKALRFVSSKCIFKKGFKLFRFNYIYTVSHRTPEIDGRILKLLSPQILL
jgi:hypothetical protein